MSSLDRAGDEIAEPTILKPYSRDPDTRRRRRQRRWIMAAVVGFCLFYGLAFAFFAPFLILMFAVPIVVLGAIAIWALPHTPTAPTRTLAAIFFTFLVVLVLWPGYLAIALPGLPWITLVRLFGAPLILVFLICVSMSNDVRKQLVASLLSVPMIWTMLVGFVLIQALTLPLSHNPFMSLDRWVTDLITGTGIFFVSSWLFLKPGRVERWATIVWAMAIPIGLIAIQEFRHGAVPWAGHIPSFLQIQDESVMRSLAPQMRAYTNRYRAHSVFSTSLGLAEYMALALPFVLHFIAGEFRRSIKIAAVVSVPFILVIVLLTNARLGFIGFCMSILFYLLFWGVQRWRQQPASLIGSIIVYGYPAIFVGFLVTTFFVGRLHRLVWGGGEYAASTDARKQQYQMGIPKVLKAPWGHGDAQAGVVLQYYQPGGMLTIDTYYLAMALDYGILGFILYFGMIAAAMYYGGRYAFVHHRRVREYSLLIPIAIALANFLIIKSVFSQEDNHPLVFMMMGMVAALVCRIKSEPALTAEPASVVPQSRPQGARNLGAPRRPRRPAYQPSRP